MSTAAIFNTLGQTLMPNALAVVLPDTLTVKSETRSTSSGGGQIKSGATNAVTGVPCMYEPIQKFGWKKDQADKINSSQMYLVTIPTHKSGTRINLDPKSHYFVVDARGSEPAKTFKIISIGDLHGVYFEVVCSREN